MAKTTTKNTPKDTTKDTKAAAVKVKVPKTKTAVPTNTTTNDNKSRHFYVFYKGVKLDNTRLSGKRPKQAAQKALTSIIKYEKKNGNDMKGKEIKFWIEETGRKKYREKKVGDKLKRVEIIKRRFYYKGTKTHIPEDPKDDFYKDKKIKTGKNAGQIRHKDVVIENGKVIGIRIKRNDTVKIVKDKKSGKEVKKEIKGQDVIYKYITKVENDNETKKVEEKKRKDELKKKKEEKQKLAAKKKAAKKPVKKTVKKTTKKPTVKKTAKKNIKKAVKKPAVKKVKAKTTKKDKK